MSARSELCVQPRANSEKAKRLTVESFIGSLPGVRYLPNIGEFRYGHPAGCVFVTLFIYGEVHAEKVRINASGKTQLGMLLAFLVAERLGWEVMDLRRGALCDTGILEEVLRTHRKDGKTALDILGHRSDWNIRLPELLRFYAGYHPPTVITFGLLMIVIAPCLLIYFFSLPTRAFVWLGIGSGLLTFAASSLVQALVHARRRQPANQDSFRRS